MNTRWALADLIANYLGPNLPIGLGSQVLGKQYAYSHQGSRGSLVFRKHAGTDPCARACTPKDKCLVDGRYCNIQHRHASPSAIIDSITKVI